MRPVDDGGLVQSAPLDRIMDTLELDDFWLSDDPALALCLRMIFSENRFPLFRIMR
jgi:hypothetical protein